MSTLKVNALQDTSGNNLSRVLQIVTAQKLDAASVNSNSFGEIATDLRCAITPLFSTSKLLIQANLYCTMSSNSSVGIFQMRKDGSIFNSPTNFESANDDGHATVYTNANFMGTTLIQTVETAGNTTARTYSPYWRTISGTMYINIWNNTDYRGISCISVMEIAQ